MEEQNIKETIKERAGGMKKQVWYCPDCMTVFYLKFYLSAQSDYNNKYKWRLCSIFQMIVRR